MAASTQTCRSCGEARPLDAFHRQSRSSTGYNTQCRRCAAEYMAAYRARNKPKVRRQNLAQKAKDRLVRHLTELDDLTRLEPYYGEPVFLEPKERTGPLHDLWRLRMRTGRSWPEQRLAELRGLVEATSEEDIQAALDLAAQREARLDDVDLAPHHRRFLQRAVRALRRREDALTDEDRTARWAALWSEYRLRVAELAEGRTADEGASALCRQAIHAERKADLREADGKSRPDVVPDDAPQWGGLGRSLEAQAAEQANPTTNPERT